jgi:hypothetical protein
MLCFQVFRVRYWCLMGLGPHTCSHNVSHFPSLGQADHVRDALRSDCGPGACQRVPMVALQKPHCTRSAIVPSSSMTTCTQCPATNMVCPARSQQHTRAPRTARNPDSCSPTPAPGSHAWCGDSCSESGLASSVGALERAVMGFDAWLMDEVSGAPELLARLSSAEADADLPAGVCRPCSMAHCTPQDSNAALPQSGPTQEEVSAKPKAESYGRWGFVLWLGSSVLVSGFGSSVLRSRDLSTILLAPSVSSGCHAGLRGVMLALLLAAQQLSPWQQGMSWW